MREGLRNATAQRHLSLERRLDLLGGGLDRNRYLRILQALFGYYLPLEDRLRAASRSGLPLKDRAPRLARDLTAMGSSAADVQSLPRCGQLPDLTKLEHWAGCLYVIEGADLGGQFIAAEVQARLGLGPEGGCSFFFGDGPQAVGRRWRGFLAWLEGLAAEGIHRSEMEAAAVATFTSLENWLERRSVLV